MYIFLALLIVLLLFIVVVAAYMQLPQFGRIPKGNDLATIKKYNEHKDGSFQNLEQTPQFTNGANFYSVSKEFLTQRSKRARPSSLLPSAKEHLKSLDINQDVIVWFGHSSYYLQIAGKRLLVDPVFSGHASPVSTSTRSFIGADVYDVHDMPDIDYLLITHDHYDHLDYKTVAALRPRVKKVVTAAGVGAHLQRWGYSAADIIEKGWNEVAVDVDGLMIVTASARHFSGRGFKRNTSLWLSFAVFSPRFNVYLGGDSGYGSHFKSIGETYGPFDLAILECGQYNQNWANIHMMPEETVQASIDLQATRLMPVHWGKFALSLHDWDEPITRAVKEAKRKQVPLLHPMIGEVVYLNAPYTSEEWWKHIG